MGKLVIVNGSPRASKSNSLKYITELKKYIKDDTFVYNIISSKIDDFFKEVTIDSEIIFVFPLYADGLPSLVISFFNSLKKYKFQNQKVHLIINCGFLEWQQNLVAREIFKLFCEDLNLNFSCSLLIGSGEAIMNTPFKVLVNRQLKGFANDIYNKKNKMRKVNMLLSKKNFIKASTKYWIKYGLKNGISKEEMERKEVY